MGEWPGPSKKTAQYSSLAATTIAASSNDFLDWDYYAGDVLLDVTDPKNPIVLESGDYAFTLTIQPGTPVTAGYSYNVNLTLDVYGIPAGGGWSYQDSPQSTVNSTNPLAPYTTVSLTYFIPAGGYINVGIQNPDVVSVDFYIDNAAIRKLS